MLVDHRDIDALADAIETLLDDRALPARLGAAARDTAIQNYSSKWIWPWRNRVLSDLIRVG